jgi:hypothetical protein
MKKRTKKILKGAAILGGATALAGGGYAAYKRRQASNTPYTPSNTPYTPGKKVNVAPSPQTVAGSAAGREAKANYKQSKGYKQARAVKVAISSKSPYVSSSNTRSSAAKSAGVRKAYANQKQKVTRASDTQRKVIGSRKAGIRISNQLKQKALADDRQNHMMAATMYAINQARRRGK